MIQPPLALPSVDKVISVRAVGLLGLIIFFIQAIFSQVYYLERMACYDPAFFSFLMLDSGSLESVLGRHGSWLSQLLPWVVLKLGGSLELFLRSYSLSFILLYVIFFLVTLYVLKDQRAALAMIICCTVGYHLSFYYSTAELYQGLALTCMLWALIRKLKDAADNKLVMRVATTVLLAIWISFYHQILIIPIAFIIVLEAFENKVRSLRPVQFIVFGVVVGWFLIRILFFERSSYEASRMVTLADFQLHLPLINTLPSTIFFKREFDELPALALSLLTAGLLLLFRKKWMQTIVYGITCVGFLVLILITDHAGQSPVMYENYYTVFGLFSAITLANSLYGMNEKIPVAITGGVIVLLLFVGIIQIQKGNRPFSVLVDHLDKTTSRMMNRGVHKGLVHMDNHPWFFSWMAWSMPFSSTLISAVNNNGEAATLYPTPDPLATLRANSGQTAFLGPEWDEDWFTSDGLYDGIQIPKESYSILNTAAISDSLNKSLRDQIDLETLDDHVEVGPGPKTFIPIRISNSSQDTLHSRSSNNGMLRIFYWIDHGNGEFEPIDQFTPIDTDIYPGESAQIYLIVNRPKERGEYKVRFDLCSDSSSNYWGVPTEFILKK